MKRTLLCIATLLCLAMSGQALAGDVCDLETAGENGNGATADGDESVACGKDSEASGDSSTAVGFNSKATHIASTALGHNSNASGGAATAIGQYAHAEASNSVALGGSSRAAAYHGVAVGAGSRAIGSMGVAVGGNSYAANAGSMALGFNAWAVADNAVAIGKDSRADEANTVSVGDTDNRRRIVNVAAGTHATDAVNLSQLQAAITTANAYTDTAVATGSTAANAYTDDREAAVRTDMIAGDAATLASAKTYADNRFAGWNDQFVQFQQQVDTRFARTDARIDRGGAMQTAMAQMTASAAGIRTVNRMAVGMGAQNGKAALSVGYQRAIGDKAALTIGGAFSGGERSAGIGYGIGW